MESLKEEEELGGELDIKCRIREVFVGRGAWRRNVDWVTRSRWGVRLGRER